MPLPNDQYNGNMMSHRFFYAVIALMYAVSGVHASPATVERDPSRVWLDVPWKIRYVLLIDTAAGMKAEFKSADKFNRSDGKNGKNLLYLDAIALFSSTASIIASKTVAIQRSLSRSISMAVCSIPIPFCPSSTPGAPLLKVWS